jgi:hypothetical protein
MSYYNDGMGPDTTGFFKDAAIKEHLRIIAAKDAEIARLREALGAMIYETASLSPMEDDGSHWCRITKEALELARGAYHAADAIAALKRKGDRDAQ